MHVFPSRFFRPAPWRLAAALMVLAGLSTACDRHTAAELPESYGHGSSHDKSYTDHQPDSRRDSRSFSDTQGIENGSESKPVSSEKPSASPVGSVSGNFFPNGS